MKVSKLRLFLPYSDVYCCCANMNWPWPPSALLVSFITYINDDDFYLRLGQLIIWIKTLRIEILRGWSMIGTARIFRKNTSTRKNSDYSLSNIPTCIVTHPRINQRNTCSPLRATNHRHWGVWQQPTLGPVFQGAVASGVKNKVGQKGPFWPREVPYTS